MIRTIMIALILGLIPSMTFATEPTVYALEVGKRVAPYSFNLATGPERGQQTCYICETASRPAVMIFARSLTPSLAKLVQRSDTLVGAAPKDGLRGWLTMLGEKTVDLNTLANWSKDHGIKQFPMGVFDDAVGPPSYRLHADSDVTVFLFVDRKVKSRFWFRAGELNESAIEKIMTEIGTLKSTVKPMATTNPVVP